MYFSVQLLFNFQNFKISFVVQKADFCQTQSQRRGFLVMWLISAAAGTVDMSLIMRKPDFCIRENKDADQLRGNRESDQRLCFRYMDSTIPLLSKSEISSL